MRPKVISAKVAGWRWGAVALTLAVFCGLVPTGAQGGHRVESAAQWAAGPVRWLLQKGERRRLKKVRSEEDLKRFVEIFWWRRDPDLQEPGNAFARQFLKRADEADLLFQEEDTRGSLSDRGGALLLLGAPSAMHRGPRSALSVAFIPEGETQYRPMEQETVEVWRYNMAEFPGALQEALGDRSEVELTFRVNEGRLTLLEGRWALEAAARAAVLRGLE